MSGAGFGEGGDPFIVHVVVHNLVSLLLFFKDSSAGEGIQGKTVCFPVRDGKFQCGRAILSELVMNIKSSESWSE